MSHTPNTSLNTSKARKQKEYHSAVETTINSKALSNFLSLRTKSPRSQTPIGDRRTRANQTQQMSPTLSYSNPARYPDTFSGSADRYTGPPRDRESQQEARQKPKSTQPMNALNNSNTSITSYKTSVSYTSSCQPQPMFIMTTQHASIGHTA